MKQCLIVDDAPVIRAIATRILTDLGYAVRESENPRVALELCRAEPPDIIFLDARLSSMTTKEFLTAIRLSALAHRPHVIYCTTENDREDIGRAISAGADDFILKPYDRGAIVAALAAVKSTRSESP